MAADTATSMLCEAGNARDDGKSSPLLTCACAFDDGVSYGEKEIAERPLLRRSRLYLHQTKATGRVKDAASAILEEVINLLWRRPFSTADDRLDFLHPEIPEPPKGKLEMSPRI